MPSHFPYPYPEGPATRWVHLGAAVDEALALAAWAAYSMHNLGNDPDVDEAEIRLALDASQAISAAVSATIAVNTAIANAEAKGADTGDADLSNVRPA